MLAHESRIELPPVPTDQSGFEVAAWAEPVLIDTYELEPPDHFPVFLDHRVYQGSSGRVYPLPFYERISSTKSRLCQPVEATLSRSSRSNTSRGV